MLVSRGLGWGEIGPNLAFRIRPGGDAGLAGAFRAFRSGTGLSGALNVPWSTFRGLGLPGCECCFKGVDGARAGLRGLYFSDALDKGKSEFIPS